MLPDERGGGGDATRYEELRRLHLADMAAMSAGLGERIDWPADRLAAHRRSLLRALVTSACERSP
jgi:hypothetical protein